MTIFRRGIHNEKNFHIARHFSIHVHILKYSYKQFKFCLAQFEFELNVVQNVHRTLYFDCFHNDGCEEASNGVKVLIRIILNGIQIQIAAGPLH